MTPPKRKSLPSIVVFMNISARRLALVMARICIVAGDKDGNIIGAALGYSWGGISELKQLWVAEPSRRRGLGSALLDKFINEARKRGARRIWLASYDFQAPALYERAGFTRVIDLNDWPIGHTNSIFCLNVDVE